ncbi:hypothetical protein V2J09_009901 [Rumex salicifolius]
MAKRSSKSCIPQIVSCSGMEIRPVISAIEKQVMNLIEHLTSTSTDTQREAASQLLKLSRDNTDNRMVIGCSGAIALLVEKLHSTDTKIQELSVTALHNLSMNQNNSSIIVNAGAIEPLIHVLETGNTQAKENSAATIYRLSMIEEYRIRLGRNGAISPLVEMLKNSIPWGKKDAVAALFNLSQISENKIKIVKSGAVELLIELMDPGLGMEDKAIVAVLASLATVEDGQISIAEAGGIGHLIEVVELGSNKGKDLAVATLCHICSNSSKYCKMLLKEDGIPPLASLLHSGNSKTKAEARKILQLLRDYQHSTSSCGIYLLMINQIGPGPIQSLLLLLSTTGTCVIEILCTDLNDNKQKMAHLAQNDGAEIH